MIELQTSAARVLRENWGFVAIGVAGGAAWALIAWAMHGAAQALKPRGDR